MVNLNILIKIQGFLEGTAIARDVSSIVLMDDNFDSLVKAVIWGRNIEQSVRKFLQFQLTVNFSLTILTIIGASVMKQPVLSAVQMLWVLKKINKEN